MISKRLRLKKLVNTRDLGGMKTADGRTVRHGKLIRSGKLKKLPKDTVEKLAKLGVTTVVDFRIQNERDASPDTVIPGVNYVSIPFLATPVNPDEDIVETTQRESARAKKEGKRIRNEFGSIDNYMISMYRDLLFTAESQKSWKQFLDLVAAEEGCILWHCASGKDRAGIASMLVEALLGVDEATIMHDYIASRKMWRARYFINKAAIAVVPISFNLKIILFGFMSIKRKYLQTCIDEMKSRYGGIVEFCKAELGVTDGFIATLKEKYLE